MDILEYHNISIKLILHVMLYPSMPFVVELSRQMSSCMDLVVEPSQLGSLKGLSGTRNTRVILVRPLTVKVKAYVQLRWY